MCCLMPTSIHMRLLMSRHARQMATPSTRRKNFGEARWSCRVTHRAHRQWTHAISVQLFLQCVFIAWLSLGSILHQTDCCVMMPIACSILAYPQAAPPIVTEAARMDGELIEAIRITVMSRYIHLDACDHCINQHSLLITRVTPL